MKVKLNSLGYALRAIYLTVLLPALNCDASNYKVYQFTEKNGVVSFSDRAPEARQYTVLRFDCYACIPESQINWYKIPLFPDKYNEYILSASRTHRVEPALIRAVIHAESAFRPGATSKKGAAGLMQLMPKTADSLGVDDPYHVAENINAGTAYLAKLLKRFNNNTALATAAYNAGPTAVSRYDGIPPYKETKAYVRRVNILLKRYRRHELIQI
ncbi:lytic transglycosylase domain-containing protein [Catenovulum sp. SM1970]|uniref:lytic transglycosylase domain-containing protein n=1 Tax=Marinifaba aquimaris TaxID=2741323 RepID=UPI001573EBBA|nr:lytic transglycosylase domain-containing protein [Marinifaba aquimaris]NTS77754.1 lytic transglycosylase domain-containing protein [Marinifaba aquimaris]